MKTFFGALAMIIGVGFFGGNLSQFDGFSLHQFSGNVFLGVIVFLLGLSTWLGGVFGD